jgi:hypothetical protein
MISAMANSIAGETALWAVHGPKKGREKAVDDWAQRFLGASAYNPGWNQKFFLFESAVTH